MRSVLLRVLLFLPILVGGFVPPPLAAQAVGSLQIVKTVCEGTGTPSWQASAGDVPASPEASCPPGSGRRRSTFQIWDSDGTYLLDLETDKDQGYASVALNAGTYTLTDPSGQISGKLQFTIVGDQWTTVSVIDFTDHANAAICSSDRPLAESGGHQPVVDGGPALDWRLQVPTGMVATGPAVSGEQLILGLAVGEMGALIGLDRNDGSEIWCTDLDSPPATLVAAGERVIVPVLAGSVTGASTTAINARTGRVVWKQPYALIGLSDQSFTETTGYAYAFSGPIASLMAFDLATGESLWRLTISSDWGFPTYPVTDGSSVFYAATLNTSMTGDMLLMAVNAENSRERWRVLVGQFGKAGALGIGDGMVVVGAKFDPPCCLVAFDSESGAELWRATEIAMQQSRPLVFEGRVFAAGAGSGSGLFQAVGEQSGGVQWRQGMGTETSVVESSPVVAAGDVLVVEPKGVYAESTLVAFDQESGATLWRLPIGNFDQASPVAEGDDVYVVGDWLWVLDLTP